MRKSAKEEAEELVGKYNNILQRYLWSVSYDTQAKECATLAQQRIINEAEFWHNTSSYEETTEFIAGEERVNYEIEILKEIEKL